MPVILTCGNVFRIENVRRITGAHQTPAAEIGSALFYAASRISTPSLPVHLTAIEYRLLSVLARNLGKVITHRQLLRDVWGPSQVEQSHYLRIYMAQLRHKLEDNPATALSADGDGRRLQAFGRVIPVRSRRRLSGPVSSYSRCISDNASASFGGEFMRWIAPTEKDVANGALEKRLREAADQFRANSGLKAGQYSAPVVEFTVLR